MKHEKTVIKDLAFELMNLIGYDNAGMVISHQIRIVKEEIDKK